MKIRTIKSLLYVVLVVSSVATCAPSHAIGSSATCRLAKPKIEFDTKLFVLKELDIRGSRNALPEDFTSVVQMLETTDFPGDALITRTAPLTDAASALCDWDKTPGKFTRIHIDLNS